MTEQIVMVGNYTYAWHGETKLKVGDVVVLPPNWLFDYETEGTVTALGSSYTGPLTRIRKLARTKVEETARAREEKAKLKDHKHKILWQLSPFGADNSRTASVNVKLLCDCKMTDLHRFASQMYKHYGWDVRTSTGYGGFEDDITIPVSTTSLKDPRGAKCLLPGVVEARRAEGFDEARHKVFDRLCFHLSRSTTYINWHEIEGEVVRGHDLSDLLDTIMGSGTVDWIPNSAASLKYEECQRLDHIIETNNWAPSTQ